MTAPTATTAAAATVPVLNGQALSFSYGDGQPIFEEVSLSVRPREIVALLGGSGCGKSTLLRALSGLTRSHSGTVEFLGAKQTRPHPRAALVFQQPSLLPWRNVAANVAFGLDFKHQPTLSKEERQARVRHAIASVGLAGREHKYPAQLSGGMAQRVALARALAREPALLFADEPFAALDAITRSEMQMLLVDLVQQWNAAVLLVTHDIDEAIVVADRIVLMGRPDPKRAARIVREWQVDIPRPRENSADAASALHFNILSELRRLQQPA
ncbi:ABC transporter ATP-binding protein [Lampropedia puyangensis]|uniref:ABC transporter ATP-binding protein n=1 Tax=Lampropedia puyangensis TaxID=1330072 RepID=A0A4V4GR17_9BURK|nr:ABC transporter ATP-binding protein [Lampropedia puyangensis]THT98785.1 ABC transporter ATP-binding protein [Lampropedia puyangensis]